MIPILAPKDRATVETGHTRGSLAHAAASHCLKSPFSVVIAKSQEVERVAAELELWAKALGEPLKVVALPTLPELQEDDEALMLQKQEKSLELVGVLGEIKSAQDKLAVVADLDALTQPMPGTLQSFALKKGDAVSIEGLKKQLGMELGYHHEALCEAPGQFAVRGGILDVYPPNADTPLRLDFFGDTLEKIKKFDPTTQRTLEEAEGVILGSAKTDGVWQSGAFANYLPSAAQWIILEPSDLETAHPEHWSVPEKLRNPVGHFSNFVARKNDAWRGLNRFGSQSEFFKDASATEVKVEIPSKYRPLPPAGLIGSERSRTEVKILEAFVKKASQWRPKAFVFSRGEVSKEFQKILQELEPVYAQGATSEGFILRQDGGATLLALSPGDLPPYAGVYTISRTGRRVAHKSAVNELLDFSQVAEGDYLVHLEHGICLYRGMSKLEDPPSRKAHSTGSGPSALSGGNDPASPIKHEPGKQPPSIVQDRSAVALAKADGDEVLSLEFDGGLVLHLRFSEAHLISRYVGLTRKKPRLSKIGSASWARAKRDAKQATLDYAAELLRLHAIRRSLPGHAFPPDSGLSREFDATFPFRLTPDQAKAIQATKADMMNPLPMDRLVCGDVGYGKTEVALRAAMKAVEGGRQVCVLCPTTILAQQHYNTFNERMAGFGVAVEALHRFKSRKEQRAILEGLSKGTIDIVVGTHRLLSGDVSFKDLGLIIIDEEHRFGVEQKEKLKRLRASVDVLAMSATPIPRTLQMALGGARDLSIIETAPQNRRPIETLVKTFDEKILKEAVEYEVSRGGQVFYLHNRVRSIAKVALRLQELFPKLRIACGHGRMPEHELEKVMTDFVAGSFDVLVCTTIIESGLDIPNCNTLVIEGADQFGLSQLYQIRGRVGRFNRQAYAYLFLHKNKLLPAQSKERLEALRAHNELGAGLKIALRDLELRGSGNLLGPEQSGHVAGVGFELYCELLKESVARLKGSGGGKSFMPRTTLRLDFPIQASIPASYLPEARLRLEIYRELALCEDMKEFEGLKSSLIDRFGKPPPPMENLLETHELRILAHEKGFISLGSDGNKLILATPDGSFYKQGSFFPRLGGKAPHQKIASIRAFLKDLPK